MKKLFIFLFPTICSAQFIAVQSVSNLATNAPLVLAGAPANMPVSSFFLTSSNLVSGYTVYALTNWISLRATNQPTWDSFMTNTWPTALSNQTYQTMQSNSSDLAALMTRFATNNLDRQNMATNTLNNANLNTVVFNILRTLHKLENLLPDIYSQNPQDAGQ